VDEDDEVAHLEGTWLHETEGARVKEREDVSLSEKGEKSELI